MNIAGITLNDIANGPGIRLSVFVSGCRIHCPGCHQPQTWNFNYGQPYTEKTKQYILDELSKPQYAGITILGGEPFEPENQVYIQRLIYHIRKQLPNKNIWMYSGCTLERLLDPDDDYFTIHVPFILNMIDVLVAGPFIQSQKDITLPYCGSRNQKIIDMKQTRQHNYKHIIEYM